MRDSRFTKLLRADRGATAIEYAVIAGLLGLGIVGSLVSTKGSLNYVFGTASSQLTKSTADSTKLPESAIASTWANKTVASITSTAYGTKFKRVYTFTDGSTVSYAPTGPSEQRAVTQFVDAAVNPNKQIIIQPQGPGGSGSDANKPYYIANTVAAAGTPNAGQQTQQDQFASNATNTGAETMTTFYYTPGQGPTSYETPTINLADYAKYFNDVQYFASIQ